MSNEPGNGIVLPDDSDYDDFGAPFVSLKDVRQQRALRAILNGNSIITACRAAGVTYSAWYQWKEDPEFRRLYERALAARVSELETDALERAKESDTLTMFFLKAWDPARYRERQVVELVSPDVQNRLGLQADAIMAVCRELLDRDTAALIASTIAGKLREIWT